MTLYVNTFFEKRVEQLFDLAGRVEAAFAAAGASSARRAVRLIFTGERVTSNYPEPAPDIGPCRILHGVRLVPLADLIRMKLTSFRSKDETHLKDLDEVGLITPEIEAGLSEILSMRLAQLRARE